jgi:hypothetical protein
MGKRRAIERARRNDFTLQESTRTGFDGENISGSPLPAANSRIQREAKPPNLTSAHEPLDPRMLLPCLAWIVVLTAMALRITISCEQVNYVLTGREPHVVTGHRQLLAKNSYIASAYCARVRR